MLRPGEVIGVPAGVPDPSTGDIVLFRWLLVVLALAAAAALARGRPKLAALAATALAASAVGFWVLALGRPYGLLVDADITRRAADRAVAAESGRADERFVAGEPRDVTFVDLMALRCSRRTLLLAPTLLPLLVLPLTAFALARVARPGDGLAPQEAGSRPDRGLVAAVLWLAFSTGDLDTTRGTGFVSGMWSRPAAALAFTAAMGVLAVLAAKLSSARVAVAAGLGLAAAWIAFGPRGRGLDPIGTLLMLTFDQGVWLLLGGWGLWRGRGGPAAALVAAGSALGLAGAVGLETDAWAAQAFHRAGLVAASVPAAREIARTIGTWIQSGGARLGAWEPARLGGALLFGLGAAGSTLVWWDPPRWDLVARQSLEPMSAAVSEPIDWLRRETPAGAVVLAAPSWAPSVAVIAGRRVLRAPTLFSPPDDDRRRRLERAILSGEPAPSPALLQRYGLRYVLAAPGDFQDLGVRAPHELAAQPHLKLRHVSRAGFRVYEIVQ